MKGDTTSKKSGCDRLACKQDVIDWLRQQHTTARAARKSVHIWLQMASKMLIDRHSYLLFEAEVMNYLLRATRGVPAGQHGVMHKWRSGPALKTCISSPVTLHTAERRCPRSISIKPRSGEAMLTTWRRVESDELNAYTTRIQLVSCQRCTDVTMSGVLHMRRKVMHSPSAFCPRPRLINGSVFTNQKRSPPKQ